MRRSIRTISTLAVAMAACLLCVTPAEAKKPPKPGGGSPGYSVIELDALPGTAYGINGQVEIVGEAGDQAQYWRYELASQNVLQIGLQDPDGTVFDKSRAIDINDDGLTAGVGWVDHGQGLEGSPLLWVDPQEAPLVLPLPQGSISGAATAVNNAGIVVGAAALEGYSTRKAIAWRVDANGGVEGPVELATGAIATAQDINENGDAVGWVNDHAVRWTLNWDEGLALTATEELFDSSLVPFSHAQSINDVGDVSGRAQTDPEGFAEAFLLMSGQLTALMPLVDNRKNATFNEMATALNNATVDHGVQVVGSAYVYDRRSGTGQYSAVVLWEEDQTVTNLTAEGGRNTNPDSVTSINDNGWVTGATFNTGLEQSVPMLMIPDSFSASTTTSVVPEPSAVSLAAIGLLGLVSCGLRRRRFAKNWLAIPQNAM
jgi:hypothetical protein